MPTEGTIYILIWETLGKVKKKILLLPTSTNPAVEAGIFANTHDQQISC